MTIGIVNLSQKFSLIKEQWDPKIIAQLNDYHFKIAKIQGEFVWHSHPDAAEEECQILMVEPAGTLNTGDTGGERTIEETTWI